MNITLDRQVLRQNCTDCGREFVVVRGSVFDSDRPIGLYLIALHGHTRDGRLAHLALAFVNEVSGAPQAAALCAEAASDDLSFTVVDWSESPWKGETYLGIMLDRNAALATLRELIFHVAGHVTGDVPEVRAYFAA
jgi:hypothetical protein